MTPLRWVGQSNLKIGKKGYVELCTYFALLDIEVTQTYLSLLRENSFQFSIHYPDVGGMLGAISIFQPSTCTKTTRAKRKHVMSLWKNINIG